MDLGQATNVTQPCECGHQIIAHSATDGCVYCACDERHRHFKGGECPYCKARGSLACSHCDLDEWPV